MPYPYGLLFGIHPLSGGGPGRPRIGRPKRDRAKIKAGRKAARR